jgi:hypothetical protein
VVAATSPSRLDAQILLGRSGNTTFIFKRCTQAAWSVIQEALERLGRSSTFKRYFSKLLKSQSVPDNIPWAVPWDELAKKMPIPACLKRIRGKLNVPRERFRITSDKTYVWAGLRLFDE